MITLDVPLKRSLERRNLRKSGLVHFLKFSRGRNLSLEILVGQHDGAIDKIAEDGHQLTVVACLEILPAEIIVLGLRSVGREDISDDILFAREIAEILVSPDRPVLGCRDLIPFKVEELVRRNVVWQDVTVTVSLEHRREDDAVEHDIILADEMNETSVPALPPLLPRLRQKFLSVGNIPDRSVKPDIEHLALGTLHRDRHAPVKVTAHGARLKTAVNPALALAIDSASPLFVLFENPITKPRLVLVQR